MSVSGFAVRALTGRSLIATPLCGRHLKKHFAGVQLGEIVTAAREFPSISRVDIQMALEKMFEKRSDSKLLGILSPMGHQPPSLAQLFAPGPFPMDIGP